MTNFFKAIAAFATALAAIWGLVNATGILNKPPELGPRSPDPGRADEVVVANVYNLPDDRGLAYLADQGFTNVRVIHVCSNSVSGGNIREVLLDDHSSLADETVFVGPLGSKPVKIPLSTSLLVKVSNGQGCP
jgi:hypothetical protein